MTALLAACTISPVTPSSSKGESVEPTSSDSSSTSQGGSTSETSKTTSEGGTSTSQEATPFDNLPEIDHIQVFCPAKYTKIWAWNDKGDVFSSWPGATLVTFDSDWKTYEFEDYTSLKIIFSIDGNSQSSAGGHDATHAGYWWFYDGLFVDVNPLLPPEPIDPGDHDVPAGYEGNIFHAFDWKLSEITNKLDDIKAAGYRSIQTSPLQAPKDYSSSWTDTSGQWWKLYQPLSFSISPSNKTWIGGASELKTLTTAAHEKGLAILVDVVANHMGSSGSWSNPPSAIATYEPDIYNGRNADPATFHKESGSISDSSRYLNTQGHMGELPDLNTSLPLVQNRVYSYLKELVDNGVDGFRFDAAKHIETAHDDAAFASDFWANTAGKVSAYAKTTYSKELFSYGEILTRVGGTGSIADYLDYLPMVTDNEAGNKILAAIESKDTAKASADTYPSRLPAKHTVLWGESHDTYLNGDGSSKNSTQADVNKAYALVSARKDSRALYFPRPGSTMSSVKTTDYKGALVSAANHFHIDMDDADEAHSSQNGFAIVERYGTHEGAVIVPVNASANAEVSFSHLTDGSYRDLVTSQTYEISGGKLTAPSGSVLVLEKTGK